MACTCGPGQQCAPLKPGCWGYQPTTTTHLTGQIGGTDLIVCHKCGWTHMRLMDCTAPPGQPATPRETAEVGAKSWRALHAIPDWEFAEIGVLLCDHHPRDLALMVVRLRGQLEASRMMRRSATNAG